MDVKNVRSSEAVSMTLNPTLVKQMRTVDERYDVVDLDNGLRHSFVFIDQQHVINVNIDFVFNDNRHRNESPTTMMIINNDGSAFVHSQPFYQSLKTVITNRNDELSSMFRTVIAAHKAVLRRDHTAYIANLEIYNEITGFNVRKLAGIRAASVYTSMVLVKPYVFMNNYCPPVAIDCSGTIDAMTALELIRLAREKLDPSLRVMTFDQVIERTRETAMYVDGDYLLLNNGQTFIMRRGRPLALTFINVDGNVDERARNRELNQLVNVTRVAINKRSETLKALEVK